MPGKRSAARQKETYSVFPLVLARAEYHLRSVNRCDGEPSVLDDVGTRSVGVHPFIVEYFETFLEDIDRVRVGMLPVINLTVPLESIGEK